MKKITLVLLAMVVLSFPVVSYAEYYFAACKEGTIFKYSVSDEVVRNFKKGELFIASRGFDEGRLLVYSLDNDKLGYVNLKDGRWFVSESSLINVETVCSTQQTRRERLEAIEIEKANPERARIEKEKREKEEREEAEAKKKEDEIKSKGVTEGAGGLKWGSTVEEFSRLKNPSPIPFGGSNSIEQKFTVGVGENVRLGSRYYMISGIGSHSANYHFYKNKFYYFSIDTGSGYGEMIKQALISKYGQPKEISPLVLYINPNAKVGTGYGWEVRDVTITLNINNMKNESHLSYIHIPTLKLRISDDKKTSEGMKKDL
jgi:hypothetical protein